MQAYGTSSHPTLVESTELRLDATLSCKFGSVQVLHVGWGIKGTTSSYSVLVPTS
jgi:hypothetical protein